MLTQMSFEPLDMAQFSPASYFVEVEIFIDLDSIIKKCCLKLQALLTQISSRHREIKNQ